MSTKITAIIIAIAFLAIGLLGYVENPIVGRSDDAIFHADSIHNIVHIVSGLLFLLFAYFLPGYLNTFLKIFGIVYFIIGLLGLLKIGGSGMTEVLGFLHVNGADNFLHLGLGLIIFLAGVSTRRTR